MSKTLKQARIGETVTVQKLQGAGPVKRRIMDMGITKGVSIFVRKAAPLGDPVEVTVRGYELSLRKADAIIDLVDATNMERNLYLTTQVMELGIPVVVALNMMDLIKKNGDEIDAAKLSQKLGCPVVEVSALKGGGLRELYATAAEAARAKSHTGHNHTFAAAVERALEQIESLISGKVPGEQLRWFAVKLFERDGKVMAEDAPRLGIDTQALEDVIAACEEEMDDDSESITTNERYNYITSIIGKVCRKKQRGLSASDKIDRIVTNRILALPIFAAVIFLVYALAMGGWTMSVGAAATDWANDGLFGDGWFLPFTADTAAWEEDTAAFEEASAIIGAYESGKSFIPMLVATGCGVPGLMASRTIEQDRDRKMTLMTTTFMPCGAKAPIIALFAGAVFGHSPWVAASAYFAGIGSVIVSGIMLKKFKAFAGEPAPFVMELPPTISPPPITSSGPPGSGAGPSSNGPGPSSCSPPSFSGFSRASASPRVASVWWRTARTPCRPPSAAPWP